MPTAFLMEAALPTTILWVVMLLSPLLTRRNLFFSVVVPADFRETPVAKHILLDYQLGVSWRFAALLAVDWLDWDGLRKMPWAGAVVGLLLAYPLFFKARRATLPHSTAPSQVREASLRREPTTWLENAGWELAPFLILGATGAYLLSHWSELPARFPVHYDFAGTPNRWADKTVGGVLGILVVQAAVLGGIVFTRWVALNARRSNLTGPGADEELKLRRRVARLLLVLEYLIAVGIGRLALNPLWPMAHDAVRIASIGSPAVALGLVIALMLIVLQSRRKSVSTGGDGTDESRWRAGIFYVNPDDPAIFVEKRFGFGWTLNFGRPLSWALLLLLLVPAVAAILLAGSRH